MMGLCRSRGVLLGDRGVSAMGSGRIVTTQGAEGRDRRLSCPALGKRGMCRSGIWHRSLTAGTRIRCNR